MTQLPAAADLTLDQQISLLRGGDFWHTQAIPDKEIPAATLSDGPHGLRLQVDAAGDNLGLAESHPSTCFPPAVTIASSWDTELAREVGAAVGAEARQLGVDVVLGPGLNIKRNPLCGRNFEYYSEDPYVAGRFAAAAVEGIQSAGVGACLKHFAVNSQEHVRFIVDAVLDERTLREIYLAGFEHAVKVAHPWTLMASYNSVNGALASQNKELLTTILRDEWGFDGLVMSDWGAVYERPEGVAAGMDLEMPGGHTLSDGMVKDAVEADVLAREDVTRSAQRVLDLVARAPRGATGRVDPDHHDLVRRAGAASTVLLTNDGTLPLRRDAKIALIGAFAQTPRFQGAGSSQVNVTRTTTALDGFAEAGVEVTYAAGYDPTSAEPDDGLIREAVRVAGAADVAVVMVGLPPRYESEGFDRDSLSLPEQHDALVQAVAAANPRTVVALSNGAPVVLPWRENVAAILESYLGGQASGGALVDVLLGDAEPGGRLAETFPESINDVASTPWYPGTQLRQTLHREGMFVGYRHHVSGGPAPAFAFGHGLSYTSFDWSDASLSRDRLDVEQLSAGEGLTVSVAVRNTGERAGSDVVQVYRVDRTGVVLRPRRELVGFAKVHLAAAESRRVDIAVEPRAFEFWDLDSGQWQCPAGEFELVLAKSSTDEGIALSVHITGGVTDCVDSPDRPQTAVTDAEFEARLGRLIPRPRPARPFDRDSTFAELATTPAGRVVRATAWRASGIAESTDEASLPMMERGFNELPLRSAARFAAGRLDWGTVDAIVAACNGPRAMWSSLTARWGKKG